MKRAFGIFGVMFWLVLAQVGGAQPPGDPVDPGLAVRLPDLIGYAYQYNPSIAKARAGWKAVIEKYRVETGLPDPELMVTYFPQPIETRLGPQDWNLTFSQKIPFPGKLSKAGEAVEAEAVLARLELDKAVRDVIVAVRESYFELWYIREARRIVVQNQGLLDQLVQTAASAYAGDKAVFLDVIKAQSQAGQLKYDALLLEDLEQTETTRLNGLLNRGPEQCIGPLQEERLMPVAFSLEEIYALAEANQEEIRMAEVRLAKAGINVDLAKFQNRPDFKVGVYYSAIGEPDVAVRPDHAGRDAVGVQFGLNIPLWFSKNEGRVESARAEVVRSQAARTEVVNQTRTQIKAMHFKLVNAKRIIELHQNELLPQATKAMQLAETWFRNGQASFSDFVETQVAYYNFELALARAKADYGRYLAKLEQQVSRNLTSREQPDVQPGKGNTP